MGDSINVETGELRKFAEDVTFDADEMMRPDMARATQPLDGVRFGEQNASGAVHAAKARYTQSLEASMRNLNEYVRAAKFMAALAGVVATDFDHAAARSDSATRINEMLRAAAAEAGVPFDSTGQPGDLA